VPIDDTFRYDEEHNPNAWLARRAKELGVPANRLFAMAKSNDPFNKGTEGDWTQALWFKRMYEAYGYHGVWLRRLHYRMANAEPRPPMLWDGVTPYLNTKPHWAKLLEASKTARILREVDAYAFTERRNKAVPTVHQQGAGVPDPDFWVSAPDYSGALPLAQGSSGLPRVFGFSDYDEPEFGIEGYDYSPEMQPNVVEIWSEVEFASLHHLASRYGVNYVPGLGHASLTAIKALLARLDAASAPGRILYVSDFDPAGMTMPNSVSRHCQFACWELEELAEEVAPEIKVDDVAVTRQQVQELGLPRMMISEKDPRRAQWELEHGEGAVEVEALDALHPGKLEEIVGDRIQELQDRRLRRKVIETRIEARNRVREAVQEIPASHAEKLQEIQEESEALASRYRALYFQLGEEVAARYRRLQARFDRHLEPLQEELQQVEDEVREALENLEVDMPDLPEAEVEEGEEKAWFYDSERGFVEQTNQFRRRQGKELIPAEDDQDEE
jgi:hypothetical protein